MKGLVICGSHNLFTVRPGVAGSGADMEIACRIKGKVLKNSRGLYNALAPGDRVIIERENPCGEGLIVGMEERQNQFSRYNQKGRAPQILAANVDQIICVTTADFPPFRPRFIDRVLLQADIAGIEAVIIRNKTDLPTDRIIDNIDVEARLADFIRIGYKTLSVSAKTGHNMGELKYLLSGKTSVLTGQSGVGKSSIINALYPSFSLKAGRLNEKYKRGNHTTTMSFMVEISSENGGPPTRIVDTPGLRRFVPDGITAAEIACSMREFEPFYGKCAFALSCSHKNETGCKIIEAVSCGNIHRDRYDSFLRMHEELSSHAIASRAMPSRAMPSRAQAQLKAKL